MDPHRSTAPESSLQCKRQAYRDLREKLYESSAAVLKQTSIDTSPSKLSGEDKLLQQIRKDLPRVQVNFAGADDLYVTEQVVRNPQIQLLMERVLFIWAIEKSTSAYAQGIDSILLLLLLIFLSDRAGSQPGKLNAAMLKRLGTSSVRQTILFG